MATRTALIVTLAALGCQGDPVPRIPTGKVTLGVIMRAPAQDPVDQNTWTLTRGARTYEITTFSLILSDLELHACPPKLAWNPLLSTAHAHVPDSATRLGTPYVLDMLAVPGKARVLGEIAPPLGSYCAMYAVITPADEDVVSLGQADPAALVGKSMVIAGRAREADGPWQAFEWSEADRRVVRIEIPPTRLTPQKDSAFWLLDRERPATIFTPDAELGTPEATRAIFEAALATLSLHAP